MEALIRAEGLILAPDSRTPLSPPFDCTVPSSARLVALVGPNGGGKTTLLRALLGEHVVRGGWLYLAPFAEPIHQVSVERLSGEVAVVPQDSPYPPFVRVLDFLKTVARVRAGFFGRVPADLERKISDTLESLGASGLSEKRLGELSAGERQRVFLARALMQTPQTLLLDEPTSALDPAASLHFWSLLAKRAREASGWTVVGTHDLRFVQSQCDWVVAMQGQAVFCGTSHDFFSGPVQTVFEFKEKEWR